MKLLRSSCIARDNRKAQGGDVKPFEPAPGRLWGCTTNRLIDPAGNRQLEKVNLLGVLPFSHVYGLYAMAVAYLSEEQYS